MYVKIVANTYFKKENSKIELIIRRKSLMIYGVYGIYVSTIVRFL